MGELIGPLDIDRLRADTPGCASVLHFNNAGSALPPAEVTEAQIAYLRRESQIGGYEMASETQGQQRDTYAAIGELIHADPGEIAIVENATRAWDMAFYSMSFSKDDRILTAEASYASNFLAMLQMAKRTGVTIDVAPSDGSGQVDVDAMRRMITTRTRLIAITHAPTNGGLLNPAADVGRIAREFGIPYLLDACQSAGQVPLDVKAIGCDMLSATGRKYLRGPRGTGFLYVRKGFIEKLEPPFIDLHSAEWTSANQYRLAPDARRFENWEGNVAGKVALGVAVRYALRIGVQAIADRVQPFASALRSELAAIDGVTVHDVGQVKTGIVTFSVAGAKPATIRDWLRAKAINVSVAAPGGALLDATRRNLPDMIRASVHYYNSGIERAHFVEMIRSFLSANVLANMRG